MTNSFDPYHQWLAIAADEQPANHYRLLGVRLYEADPNVLQNAADQRMAHLRTFQAGPRGQVSQRLLNEVAAALHCLLTPDLRARYDDELQREQCHNQAQAAMAVGAVAVEPRFSGVSAIALLPHCATMPPPVPAPRVSTPVTASQPSRVQVSSAPVNKRRSESTSAVVAVVKVVVGGVAGLAVGVLFLWGVVGVDPFRLFGKQAAVSSQTESSAKALPPLAQPVTLKKVSPQQINQTKTTPAVFPNSVTETPAEAPLPPAAEPTEPASVASTEPQPQLLSLAESPVYLSDLRPVEVVTLQVPAVPVRVRAQQSAHGIFLHPSANSTARIAFDLARKYRSLTGAAALNDSANGPALSPLTMRIVGDGQTLWTSKPIRSPGDAEQFLVNIAGIARLELQVQCPGADGRAHASWFAVMADPTEKPNNEELEKLFPSGKPKPRELSELLKTEPTTEKAKLPAPSPDKLAAAEKTFAEVMGAEIAAVKSLEAKAKLADKLLQLGASPDQDAASQYVVLSAACSKAVDLSQLLKGLLLLEQRFDGDLTDVRLLGFESVKGQITSQQIEQFAEMLLRAIESAERKDRFDAAEQISKIGQASGRKLNDRRLTDAFVDRSTRIAKLSNAFLLVKPSLLTAQANPDDQESAFRSGQYIGYVRNDWKAALPLLARTTDDELQALVRDDLKNPAETADIMKLADRWWDRADASSAMSQEGMRRRAAHWYRLIPPGKLQGLDAQKVAKRIAATETDWLASWRPYSPAATFAKQVVGRYRLFTTNLGSKERTQQGLVTIDANREVKHESGEVFGHWRPEGLQLRLDFSANGHGHALLQQRNRQWVGHHHRQYDKTVWGWELVPE